MGGTGRDEETRTSGGADRSPFEDGISASGQPLPLSGDLRGLFDSLGRYLEGHAPADIILLLREELDRRELRAYASGWRDAVDEYEAVLERRRSEGRASGRLRLVGRTPGQAAVIPFPQERPREHQRDRAKERSAGRPDVPHGHPDPGSANDDGPPRQARRSASPRAESRPPAEAAGPAFVPKRRASKVPTVPTLLSPWRPRRDRSPAHGDDPG